MGVHESRVETSSQGPSAASIFAQPPQQLQPQRPPQVVVEPNSNTHQNNIRNYYNMTSTLNHAYEPQSSPPRQQQQSLPPLPPPPQSSYDSYYSVYDDDIDLYRDVEYNHQQQQQQQHTQQYRPQQPIRNNGGIKIQQQSTYRPSEVLTTPTPQVPSLRETYISKPLPQKPHQQSLIYNTDYDEDLIAQVC